MTSIPIELFAIFCGLAVVFVAIGLSKKEHGGGSIVFTAGAFLLITGLLTDIIILGKVPQSSTTVGSTTTYVMVDNTFTFTQWHKVLMSMISVILMLVGYIVGSRS